jgi:DNA-binding IclR family transcriptional regulator
MRNHNIILRKGSRILSFLAENEKRMRESGIKVTEIAGKTGLTWSHVSKLISTNSHLFAYDRRDRSNYIRLTVTGLKIAKLCYQIEILEPSK